VSLPAAVEAVVVAATGRSVERVRPAGGGSINEAAVVDAGDTRVFVKWHRGAPPGFFAAEADGLARLRASGAVRTPEVLAWDDDAGLHHGGGAVSVLVLSHHEPGRGDARAHAAAGRALAELHAARGLAPGLARDNYMGAVPQRNAPATETGWIPFFRERRLGALASALPTSLRRRLDRLDLEARLTEPAGGCALLHGDLWGGNLLTPTDGGAVFIDPAVYCGHPEVDLAMTRLFGGFSPAFYAAYQEVAGPFDADLDARLDVLNLYPLLVHVHLFGGGYLRQVEATLIRYG